MDNIKVAVILAGGKGTRLGVMVKDIPKPLIDVKGKPLLVHLINHLKRCHIEKVILSLGYLSDVIKSYFDKNPISGINIVYVEESSEKPLGTGGPLGLVKDLVDGPFLVLNGDTLTDVDINKIYRFHVQKRALVTVAIKKVEDVSGLGCVKLSSDGRITEFIEKEEIRSVSNFVNIGVYVIEPDVINLIKKGVQVSLEKEIFPVIAKQGRLFGFKSDAQYFDIGTPERLENARKLWVPHTL